mgnify:FL=1
MGIEDYIYKYELKYREFDKKSSANTNIYKPEVIIKGMRVKGYKKYTDSKDGTSVTCSIVFRVPFKLKVHSLLEGYEVMESVKIDSPLNTGGYLVYVR